uniref:Protein kinase domain-containing protein n=1 Tax=Macrostomum lignano TaxID=282301 RepID=A0A1I8HJF8_9PLAT
ELTQPDPTNRASVGDSPADLQTLTHDVIRGDFGQVRRLATRQLVTSADAARRTVLMRVANFPVTPVKSEKCILYLFELGANPKAADANGDTAAHLAARRDHLRLLTLLSFDAKWLQNDNGATPLMKAARTGSWKCAKHLLHLLRNERCNEREKHGNSKRSRLLGLQDREGRTASDLARLSGHSELASYIEREMRLVVDSFGYIFGLTAQVSGICGADAPLQEADRQELERLADAGDSAGLRRAATRGSCDLPDRTGQTALMWAALNSSCGDEALWEQLVQLGDPTCANIWAGSCLHFAAKTGNSAAASALLAAGASANARVGRVLLDSGADCSLKDYKGDTALYLATQEGRSELAELLRQPRLIATTADRNLPYRYATRLKRSGKGTKIWTGVTNSGASKREPKRSANGREAGTKIKTGERKKEGKNTEEKGTGWWSSGRPPAKLNCTVPAAPGRTGTCRVPGSRPVLIGWPRKAGRSDTAQHHQLRLIYTSASSPQRIAASPRGSSLERSGSKIQRWDAVRLIGRGGFGEVHEVRTDTGVTCAAKTLRLPLQLGDELPSVSTEIHRAVESERNLCRLRHPNIVRFLHIAQPEPAAVVVFMELLDGRTLERFIDNKPLDEPKIRDFSEQICRALLYLHSRQPPVIHRDINCSNMIVRADNTRIKLIDFGLSIKLEQSVSHMSASTQSPKGTLNFMAPELLGAGESDSVQYSRESDIWAFGCSVFQMASGARPFANARSFLEMAQLIDRKGAPALPNGRSAELRDFYSRCTAKDRKRRRSAQELLGHEFLTDYIREGQEAMHKDRWQLLYQVFFTLLEVFIRCESSFVTRSQAAGSALKPQLRHCPLGIELRWSGAAWTAGVGASRGFVFSAPLCTSASPCRMSSASLLHQFELLVLILSSDR